MAKSVKIRAPSSTANLGPGFDIFGLALDALYDEINLTKKGKNITIVSSDDIPLNPTKDTAGLVVAAIKKKFRLKDGIEINIKKNVPAGFGMGSRAANLRTFRQRSGSPSAPAADRSRSRGDPCLLYTSPSPRDGLLARMPSSA